MPELHLTPIYIAAAAWVAQRAFMDRTDRAQLIRSAAIAILIGVVAWFVPMHSGWMVLLLCAAYLGGTLGLTAIFSARFGGGQSTFSGTLLVLFGFLFLSMVVLALPLVLIVWLNNH